MLSEHLVNGGSIEYNSETVRLTIPSTSPQVYVDAQLDNYQGHGRTQFPNRPPVSFSVKARASHAHPVGTLGFGFWNDPFSLNGGVLAAPQAVWFFYASPPSDMALVDSVPGWGWKAATLNAGRLHPLILAPAALAAVALTQIPGLGRWVMSTARQMVSAHETLLADITLTDWHEYRIDWHATWATFQVDGIERLRSPAPPPGPLGFVTWIDNQYAIASREGKFQFGLCSSPETQWLELSDLTLL